MRLTIIAAMTDGQDSALDGELLFDLAPHLASVGTFMVGRNAYGIAWQVTNLECGRTVSGTHGTKRLAIASAKKRLGRVTPEELLRAYKKAGVE